MFKLQNVLTPLRRRGIKLVAALTAAALIFTTTVLPAPSSAFGSEESEEALMETEITPVSQVIRLAGDNRYLTAIKISQEGWETASTVVLARGDKFPDALAGAVLAKSPVVNGPLLLTPPNYMRDDVLAEIERLGAVKVYILGGTTAVSASIEQALTGKGIEVVRLEGSNRSETAAKIALTATPQAAEAFIATEADYPDALSIASYAASNGIPLLLANKNFLPEATIAALKQLGVQKVTLIGGETVITPAVKQQLESLLPDTPLTVDRLYGDNRYATNSKILESLSFNMDKIYLATGTDFPDALAGAALAAQGGHPILLLPKDKPNPLSESVLNDARNSGATFALLGGWSAISYKLENIIRTGVDKPLISLQYLQYNSANNYKGQINAIPHKATDYVDFVVPNWFALDAPAGGSNVSPGTFSVERTDVTPSYQKEVIDLAHSRGLRILPMIASIGSIPKTDAFLKDPAAQARFVDDARNYLRTSGADGLVIDFESMSDDVGPQFVDFMAQMYQMTRAENRLLVAAVPAKTATTTWYDEFIYEDLVKYTDYLNIMAYDYSTSTPGPIAPQFWVEQVLKYTDSVVDDMSKILLGVAYYGRDWTKTTGSDGKVSYSRTSISYSRAMELLNEYGGPLEREAWYNVGIGTPHFKYTDANGKEHLVYFDDEQSWSERLSLINQYGLGGVGCWSHYWVNEESGAVIFPLLNRYLR